MSTPGKEGAKVGTIITHKECPSCTSEKPSKCHPLETGSRLIGSTERTPPSYLRGKRPTKRLTTSGFKVQLVWLSPQKTKIAKLVTGHPFVCFPCPVKDKRLKANAMPSRIGIPAHL